MIENKVCCFTGHRPEKLNITEQEAKKVLESAVKDAISRGFTTFISGMARGTDMWAAEIVLREKENNAGIRLVCALPHPDFEKKWSKQNQELYNYILSKADEIHTVCEVFSMGAYMKRNKWMVDHSTLVLAFYNGTPGGTRNTIEYAKQNETETIIL
ncbi:MAG: DUF1273 family protein [Clostridia bacterium]|nr:DUF1273 family protein [Clostridia bacterium]